MLRRVEALILEAELGERSFHYEKKYRNTRRANNKTKMSTRSVSPLTLLLLYKYILWFPMPFNYYI